MIWDRDPNNPNGPGCERCALRAGQLVAPNPDLTPSDKPKPGQWVCVDIVACATRKQTRLGIDGNLPNRDWR